MKKFREWMHGRGRGIVMAVVAVVALCLITDYYRGKNQYLSTDGPNPTVSPKSPEEEKLGGDMLAPAPTGTAKPTVSPSPDAGSASGKGKNISRQSATVLHASPAPSDMPIEAGGTDSPDITLGFAGDICLDDSSLVMRHMRKKGGIEKVISPSLIKKMNEYDAMVINNEFSISDRGTRMEGKAYTFRSSPGNLKYLKQLGVDVAGLANNHIYDYGRTAFLDTLDFLREAGFKTMGAGRNIREAKKPVYLAIKGKRIAIVAATRAEKLILTPAAKKNSPGVFRTYDSRRYVREIEKAKMKADYVIAYVHWGTEYSTKLEEAQMKQAEEYIDAGADVVIGAHTHCMQGVGYYKGVPIFYSLGNFWFNEKTLYTTVLEITIDQKGNIHAKLVPCLQKGMETRILEKNSKKRKFVEHINGISTNGRLDRECNVIKR